MVSNSVKGVEIDFKGSARYFQLAADQGFADAQFNYGLCLQKGEGVENFNLKLIAKSSTLF
jgi:TPR repeat protein